MSLKYFLSGDPAGKPMVFLHGWPDDETLWTETVVALPDSYFKICLRLPGFEEAASARPASFIRAVDELDLTLAELLKNRPQEKIIMVGHDWGAYLAYIFEQAYPERVERLITLDVGPGVKPRSPGHLLFLIAYQWWLIAAWALGELSPAIGNGMSRALARLGRAPHPERTHSKMNYFYFDFWRKLFKQRSVHPGLAGYRPRVPVLFLYGSSKPYMFHSLEWERWLETQPRCRVERIPGAHWFLKSHAQQTQSVILNWL